MPRTSHQTASGLPPAVSAPPAQSNGISFSSLLPFRQLLMQTLVFPSLSIQLPHCLLSLAPLFFSLFLCCLGHLLSLPARLALLSAAVCCAFFNHLVRSARTSSSSSWAIYHFYQTSDMCKSLASPAWLSPSMNLTTVFSGVNDSCSYLISIQLSSLSSLLS